MSRMTMLDLAKLNGNDVSIGIIEEGIKTCPEVANFPARQIAGTSYTTARRIGRPSVGFRNPNAGVDASKSVFAKDLHEMFVLSGRVELDKAIVDGEDSVNLRAEETVAVGVSTLESIGAQVWYGTKANASGFAGLQDLCGSSRVSLGDITGSATTKSSVYLVRYGFTNGVSFDLGKNSTINLSEFRAETLYDASNKPFPGYVADLSGWIGLSVKTLEAIWRIANVGTESAKVGLSDKIIAGALQNWRGAAPDAIYMSRTAAFLLQCSRSYALSGNVKLPSNVAPFAPAPTESNSIPIVITDSLADDEDFVSL